MKPRAFALVCLAFLHTGLAVHGQGKLEYIDVHKPLPSTALLLTSNAMGSGFLVDRTNSLVVTNYHVVEEHKTIAVLFPVIENLQAVVTRDYYLKKAQKLRGTVIARDLTRDLAVVQLDRVPFEVPELPLAGTAPRVGDRTSMVGNPGEASRVWVWAPGEVKQIGALTMQYASGQKVQAKTIEVLADPKFGPGTSGGPAVNSNGELIGVMAAQKTLEPMRKVYIHISEVRVLLGLTYRHLGVAARNASPPDYNRSIALCTKAIDTNPADPLNHNERGVGYAFQDRNDEAIADYSEAIRLNPKTPLFWRNRGSAYFYKGAFQKAVEDCSEAIRLDPRYARAYLTRGKAYAKLGKADLAKADFDQAVKLDASLKP